MKLFCTCAIALTLCSASAEAQTNAKIPSGIQVENLSGGLGIAPSTITPRPLNATSLELIKHFEGWSATPYNDSAGYCTIGFGHLIALKRCNQIDLGAFRSAISPRQGAALLEKDTELARLAVQRRIKFPISSDEFGALTSFVFNLGEKSLTNSTLLRLLKIPDRPGASKQFKRWVRAGDRVEQGLVVRRRCEATLFVSQLALAADGRFDRNRCVDLGAAASSEDTIDIYRGESQ